VADHNRKEAIQADGRSIDVVRLDRTSPVCWIEIGSRLRGLELAGPASFGKTTSSSAPNVFRLLIGNSGGRGRESVIVRWTGKPED
jgi:hypothetical protein